MRDNFVVLKGQMGFNNPQDEANRFSLRHELFRLRDYVGCQVAARRCSATTWPTSTPIRQVAKLAKRPYGEDRAAAGAGDPVRHHHHGRG